MNVKLACTCCKQALNRLGTVELSPSRSVSALRTTILHLRKRLQLDVKLACTCCRPLVDLELLSCHHHNWFRLRKTRNPSSKQKAADECQTGLYLLQALSGLGTAELSPPQLVSALKTRNHSHLRKRLQMDVKLACTRCRPLVDLELLSCHHHGLFRLRKSKNPSSKQQAADQC